MRQWILMDLIGPFRTVTVVKGPMRSYNIIRANIGNTFYKMKQPEKAVEAWRRALELDPMNENARRGLRMFQQDPSHN